MVNQRIRSYELSDFTRDNEKMIKKMILRQIKFDSVLLSKDNMITAPKVSPHFVLARKWG